jgi:hypothetical protein
MTPAPNLLPDPRLARLDELAEIGMEIARTIGRQVKAIAPDETPVTTEALTSLEGLSRAYGRAARAVRLTLMLHDKVANPAHRQETSAHEPVTHIIRTFVDVDHSQGGDGPSAEGRERLDRETPDSLPVYEIIAHICQDLGLDAEWSQLATETWSRGEPVSAAPGWPLTSLGASP